MLSVSVLLTLGWVLPSWSPGLTPWASTAHALEQAPREARVRHAQAKLVAEARSIRPGAPFWVALELRMDPHWHTYWQNPGDSGMPTQIDWKLPEGFKAGEIQWPAPQRIEVGPLASYAYEGVVYLLTEIIPPRDLAPGKSVKLEAKARWLVCKEICIPEREELVLEMPVDVGEPAPSPWRDEITATLQRLPRLEAEWSTSWKVESKFGPERLEIAVEPKEGVAAPARIVDPAKALFFPLTEGLFEPATRPEIQKTARGLLIRYARPSGAAASLKSWEGVLVFKAFQNGKTRDQVLRLGTGMPETAAAGKPTPSAWKMWLFALLGGLILNLMPCVFPVISIKVLSFLDKAGKDPKRVRIHGLVFCAGILLSFWAVAGALLGLQAAGHRLGWGFQLQSPTFLAALSLLFFALGLNLLGVFEIGSQWMGVGSKLAERKGYAGSFFSGVLATVVATPCTAPFMGTAVGFALSQNAWVGMLIFTGLAIGMLLPYLVLSFAPGAFRLLPRPGLWMETLKQGLAFPLFATLIWLLWTFGKQTGVDGLSALLAAIVLLALAIWLGHRKRRLLGMVAGALSVAMAWRAAQFGGPLPEAGGGQGAWRKFSPEAVTAVVSQGKPVFIDFTASWCITCQVNKRVALEVAEVEREFEKRDVIRFRADWTLRDPVIASVLESYGRSGVPLYVLYPGGENRSPLILPEILTPGIVLEALGKIEIRKEVEPNSR